jgi:hypothetical protein
MRYTKGLSGCAKRISRACVKLYKSVEQGKVDS